MWNGWNEANKYRKIEGHSVGIPDSYYRATENDLLRDYLKAVPLLTITSEYKLQKQMEVVIEQSKNNDVSVKSQLYDKGHAITNLKERNSNFDAIASLAEDFLEKYTLIILNFIIEKRLNWSY